VKRVSIVVLVVAMAVAAVLVARFRSSQGFNRQLHLTSGWNRLMARLFTSPISVAKLSS
jgi:hypothetical protein